LGSATVPLTPRDERATTPPRPEASWALKRPFNWLAALTSTAPLALSAPELS
jgi:hypothetical protein